MKKNTATPIGLTAAYGDMLAVIVSGIILLFTKHREIGIVFLAFIPAFFALLSGSGALPGIGGQGVIPLVLGSVALTVASTLRLWIAGADCMAVAIVLFVSITLFCLSVFAALFVVNIRSGLKKLFSNPGVLLKLPYGRRSEENERRGK